jgi:hypothetical protein
MRTAILPMLLAATLATAALADDSTTPPLPNPHDGCSCVPDINDTVFACCDAHDEAYWRGGTKQQRKDADIAFRQCVSAAGHSVVAGVYYYGVRMGGVPWLPTPFRWGFGWPYAKGHRGYEKPAE